jgi:hypothetical protein
MISAGSRLGPYEILGGRSAFSRDCSARVAETSPTTIVVNWMADIGK